MPYPFESYIPEGRQEVPRIRGFVMQAETAARVYYSASRLFRVDKKDEITPKETVNSIIPNFFDDNIPCGNSAMENTFADLFLGQLQRRLETGSHVETRAERLAAKFIVNKPESFTREQWVKFFQLSN